MSGALEVRQLRVQTRGKPVSFPVDGVSLEVKAGECLGIVGESGAGKSLTLRAALDLLPAGTRLHSGEVLLAGRQHSRAHPRRGEIGMVFQEPGASLNPLMRVGAMIAEGLRARGLSRARSKAGAITLLSQVGIEDPELRARSWPHELSGGQRQRVAIALALASEPTVLLCDEPTTALDVTVQQRILALLRGLQQERDLAIVFVTHDLAVVAEQAQRLAVMYAGRIVEEGPCARVLCDPRHPYTARLLDAQPTLERHGRMPRGIPGSQPDPRAYPPGCRFHPRCEHKRDDCLRAPYTLEDSGPDRRSACVRWRELEDELSGARA